MRRTCVDWTVMAGLHFVSRGRSVARPFPERPAFGGRNAWQIAGYLGLPASPSKSICLTSPAFQWISCSGGACERAVRVESPLLGNLAASVGVAQAGGTQKNFGFPRCWGLVLHSLETLWILFGSKLRAASAGAALRHLMPAVGLNRFSC